MDIKLSNNFSLSELTRSATASKYHISNTPGSAEISNLTKLSKEILQPIRDAYKKSIHISSGYRCSALNQKVGGVNNSQHLYGQAADIDLGNKENKALFKIAVDLIKSKKITVGQLIWENNGSWIHISLPTAKLVNQVLDLKK
jgi:uncharacterized protein YcbK (DUF882 family)